jgi:hypothetical protein
MTVRAIRTLARLLPVAAVAACATYVPPLPAPPQEFSRDFAVPYDQAWAAAMRAADAGAFRTEAADKADGSITLGFWTRDPAGLVDCGATGSGPAGAATLALRGLGFDAAFLQGTAHIEVRRGAGGRATVRVGDQYRLGVYRIDPIGLREKIAEFRFTSSSADTRRVGLLLVTCRASHEFERALLDQVAARI